MDERRSEKKNKTKHTVRDLIIVVSVSVVLIGLFSGKLILPGNLTVQPGTYRYTGTGGGEIVVSDDCYLCFRDFDLNKNLQGIYYTEDLNSIYRDRENKFTLILTGPNGEYCLVNTFQDGKMLEIAYYPREDKLILLKPSSETEFTFVLQKV